MTIPEDLRYSKSHEWVRVDGDSATLGITDFAQSEMGELVYVELPPAGRRVEREQPFGVVESVKAVEDLYSPVTGEVTEANEALQGDQSPINDDPYGAGWLIKVKLSDPQAVESLLTSEQYAEYLASGGGH